MVISKDIATQIIEQAEREAPIEACGYLAGAGGRITKVYPMSNTERREDHFSFAPAEQFAVLKAVREECLEIIGAYHSHPATPARPSAEDIRLAFDPDMIYMIVSLMDGKKDIKAFRIREGMVKEETLVVQEEK